MAEDKIDRKQCLFLRMVPGKAPIIELGAPRLSTVERLLAVSNAGTLLVVSSVQVPVLACTYLIRPGFHDDIAVFSQHIGGLYA